jgi:hypothetical protein
MSGGRPVSTPPTIDQPPSTSDSPRTQRAVRLRLPVSVAGEQSRTHGPGVGNSPPRAERVTQIVIMLLIGTAAGAGSFTHVHDVAAAHGQAGWLAWADAVVLELMSIASGLELRRRRQAHAPVVFPAAVLATAVVLSLGAQVVDAEPSPIGWIAAAIPALGFLVMVKIALGHSTTHPSQTDSAPPELPPSRDTAEPDERTATRSPTPEPAPSWRPSKPSRVTARLRPLPPPDDPPGGEQPARPQLNPGRELTSW